MSRSTTPKGSRILLTGSVIKMPYLGPYSLHNTYSETSRLSEMTFLKSGGGSVNLENHKKLVNEIVDKMFSDQQGFFEKGSSECLNLEKKCSDYSIDKRLQYWKDIMKDRRFLQRKIQVQTNKNKPEEVLFNRRSTVDERDKHTIQRVLDYADRMKPTSLQQKQIDKLPNVFNRHTCSFVKEIPETWPKAERIGQKGIEISGVPLNIQHEMIGKSKDLQSHWLYSNVLEQRILDQQEDIQRVVAFYPDIEHLQVVGVNVKKTVFRQRPSRMIAETTLRIISSETSIISSEEPKFKVVKPNDEDASTKMQIIINDRIYEYRKKRNFQPLTIQTLFECEPFQKVHKDVLRIENIGENVVHGVWERQSFYRNIKNLFLPVDNSVIINTEHFSLSKGEHRQIRVLFQPRKAIIMKEKWKLTLYPNFFCTKHESIILRIEGKCVPPIEYQAKADKMQSETIDKSNQKVLKKVTTHLASLTPLINSPEIRCPYQREFDEREIFNAQNFGYNCQRYDDLELLKSLHKRLKKPRDRQWNLKLESIKNLIMLVESADQREIIFNNFIGILEGMKGTPANLNKNIKCNPERERTRFIYVRGIISNSIDEWESLIMSMEISLTKQEMQLFNANTCNEEKKLSKNQMNDSTSSFSEEELPITAIMRKLRHSKYFKDSLYVHTYSLLCDVIENIVSVVESTEYV